MFWKYNNNSSSEIDALLSKEDVTLAEVMDAEDIINQCKGQTKGLIEFLLKPEMMEELVGLITKEPSIELDERIRFKYPNIACELLTSDVPAINERLASDENLLDKLYTFLECEPPLNPLLASYFSRIMGALIAKKTEQNWLSYQFTCLQVLDFLKAKDTFMSLLLKHLGTSAIMDLMLKLMTQVESIEMRQNILNWLDSQSIMQALVGLLNAKVDTERHYNVAQLLCDFIRVGRDTQRNSTERVDPDPLLNTLESPETVALLLNNIFEGDKSESAIVGGIQVLLALLDVNPLSIPKLSSQVSYNSSINDEAIDIEHKERVLQSISESIQGHLKDFHDLLLNPPHKAPIITTVGVLDPPLGNTRLQVTRLFAAAISTHNVTLMQELINLDTFQVLLDLFFKYSWNNFLHAQVENCIISAFSALPSEEYDDNENALCRHLLVKCNVISRILDAWRQNDEQQKIANGTRQGYMGHLISIVNKLVEFCSNTALGKFLQENLPEVAKSLDEFSDSTLKEANALQEVLLGGAYPNTSNEENDDFGDAAFPQEQNFIAYQTPQLSSNVDGYSGLNDNAFNEGDDTLQTIDHRTDMNFALNDGDLDPQYELFKHLCSQHVNTLDDADDQIFEDRDHTFRTVIEKNDQNETVFSNDSDDDSPATVPMDVDPWRLATGRGSATVADPWDTPAKGAADAGDWADFSSFSFEPNFDEVFHSNVKPTQSKTALETDLKLECIEIEPKHEAANPDSKEIPSNVSIEKVAQVPESGEAIPAVITEPSNAPEKSCLVEKQCDAPAKEDV